jgi:hypothetical protein
MDADSTATSSGWSHAASIELKMLSASTALQVRPRVYWSLKIQSVSSLFRCETATGCQHCCGKGVCGHPPAGVALVQEQDAGPLVAELALCHVPRAAAEGGAQVGRPPDAAGGCGRVQTFAGIAARPLLLLLPLLLLAFRHSLSLMKRDMFR